MIKTKHNGKQWQTQLLSSKIAVRADKKLKEDGYHCCTDPREIEVCLNCKRKDCTGGKSCFKHLYETKNEL